MEVFTPSPAGTPPKPAHRDDSSSKKLLKDQLALVDAKTADGGTRKEVRPSRSGQSLFPRLRCGDPYRRVRCSLPRRETAFRGALRAPPAERRVAAPFEKPL